MDKRKKSLTQTPDEILTAGPFQIARFGQNILWQNIASEDELEELHRYHANLHPELVRQLDATVTQIAHLISVLPPEVLLLRAWTEMASRYTEIETEAELDANDTIQVRMLDYVQSVIASIPPSDNKKTNLSDDDWELLKEKVRFLFDTLNVPYQISRTAKHIQDNPNCDMNMEEFYFKAQMYWCNVRGSRYQVHEPEYLREMFLPHSQVFLELFNISSAQFVDEIVKIWYSLSFGLGDALKSIDEFQREVALIAEDKLRNQPQAAELDIVVLYDEVITEQGWESRRDDLFGQCFGTYLVDLQKITCLPEELLIQLSWSPGEEKTFFAPGAYIGWPLRVWPVFRRPFIRLSGKFYCFEMYSLFDNIYRIMERIIMDAKPDYREKWNSIQKSTTERLPLQYLERLLPGASIYAGIHYPGKTKSGKTDWCELDGLVRYDDHLFIVEARGGAFTRTPPVTDFPAYIESIKNLILKPATQGERFLEYLGSWSRVALFDREHRHVGEMYGSELKHVTVCAVTLDPFTEIAAQVQHLRKIDIDVSSARLWSISVDDLRVYADVFQNPLIFLHYVEQRIRAFQSNVVETVDEMDHLALYNRYNHYTSHIETIQEETAASVEFLGYRAEMDRYFTRLLRDPDTACSLTQEIPRRVSEIVECLARSSKSGRMEVARFLLDLDGDWRKTIGENIEKLVSGGGTSKQPPIFSTHVGVALTLACWKDGASVRNSMSALEHAQTVALMGGDSKRLLIELSFTKDCVLSVVDWTWVDLSLMPKKRMQELQAEAKKLRVRRIANAKVTRGKIGRNEQCPCGSGRKFKKCCLELERKQV